MKLYIKTDNYTIKFALIMTAIADVALIVFGIAENTMNTSLVIACGLTVLVTLLWMVARNEGLVIEKDKLFYKSIRKKYYELNQIAGLHIVKDQIYLGNLSCINLKIKGEYKYKIIYLNDKDFDYNKNYGVHEFNIHYSKYVLFSTVYNEEVIEYFKQRGIQITGERM